MKLHVVDIGLSMNLYQLTGYANVYMELSIAKSNCSMAFSKQLVKTILNSTPDSECANVQLANEFVSHYLT